MDDKTFKSITGVAAAIVDKSKAIQEKYDKMPDMNTWSANDINSYIKLARNIQSQMDLWVKTDLYHIVGMAHLSAKQMSVLMKQTAEMLEYRSTIKTLATLPLCPTYSSQMITELENYSLSTDSSISFKYPVTKIETKSRISNA